MSPSSSSFTGKAPPRRSDRIRPSRIFSAGRPSPQALGSEAFGEHSCTKGNGNAVKNGRQASILFAPVKPHPESGSVERLKAVAALVYGKL
ncbi:hypothetical protein XH96_19395 [Bradyrhizobium sp. CCBAU 51765]|nr:hypothetical protein XH96_19395 [Bradyrhizobium sp. CCBAU 51765]